MILSQRCQISLKDKHGINEKQTYMTSHHANISTVNHSLLKWPLAMCSYYTKWHLLLVFFPWSFVIFSVRCITFWGEKFKWLKNINFNYSIFKEDRERRRGVSLDTPMLCKKSALFWNHHCKLLSAKELVLCKLVFPLLLIFSTRIWTDLRRCLFLGWAINFCPSNYWFYFFLRRDSSFF